MQCVRKVLYDISKEHLSSFSNHFKTAYFYRPQRSCGKVIFSQASVSHSVHRRGGCLPQCMLGYTPCRYTLWQVHLHAGTPPGRYTPMQVHPHAGTTPRRTGIPSTVTAADGTHPTGMLSCYYVILSLLYIRLCKCYSMFY